MTVRLCLVLSVICLWGTTGAAALIDFRGGGNLGSQPGFDLNDSPPATFSISGLSPLTITLHSIGSSSVGAPRINSNADRFGIDSTGTGSGSDDSDHFDSGLSETVSFSFNRAVRVNSLDFINFGDTESFEFAGLAISGTDTNLNGFDVLDLSAAPLVLGANQIFSMQATSGSIGFQSMDVTMIPEPSSMTLFCAAMIGVVMRRRRRD